MGFVREVIFSFPPSSSLFCWSWTYKRINMFFSEIICLCHLIPQAASSPSVKITFLFFVASIKGKRAKTKGFIISE